MKKEGYKHGVPASLFESKEKAPVLCTISLGYDGVKTKNELGQEQGMLIEINGQRSGIDGIQDEPSDKKHPLRKLFASMRSKRNPQIKMILEDYDRFTKTKSFKNLTYEQQQKFYKASEEAVSSMPLFENAFVNPSFIEDIGTDKSKQMSFLPSAPRTYVFGDSAKSKSGLWVLKKNKGLGGSHVTIVTNEEFERILQDDINRDAGGEKFMDSAVAQEYVEAKGAELVPESLENNPASIRVLVDAVCRTDGTIEIVSLFAYQRVSPYSALDEKAYPDDIHIVNKARGALSFPASEREIELFMPSIMKSMEALVKGYKESLDTD